MLFGLTICSCCCSLNFLVTWNGVFMRLYVVAFIKIIQKIHYWNHMKETFETTYSRWFSLPFNWHRWQALVYCTLELWLFGCYFFATLLLSYIFVWFSYFSRNFWFVYHFSAPYFTVSFLFSLQTHCCRCILYLRKKK